MYYSNIPNIIELWSPNVTLEGDTMVMYQQTAKTFVKNFRLVQEYDKKLTGIYSFLNDYKQVVGQKSEITDFKNNDQLLKLFEAATLLSIHEVCELLPDMDDEVNYDIKWNKHYQLEIITAARLNAIQLVASMFKTELETRDLSQNLKHVLDKCLQLYLADMLVQFGEILILKGYIEPEMMVEIKEYVDELIEQIRPHALMLTESFLYLDMLLHSKLSLTDGTVYEQLYNQAANSKLNEKTVIDGVSDYVRPLKNKLRRSAKI